MSRASRAESRSTFGCSCGGLCQRLAMLRQRLQCSGSASAALVSRAGLGFCLPHAVLGLQGVLTCNSAHSAWELLTFVPKDVGTLCAGALQHIMQFGTGRKVQRLHDSTGCKSLIIRSWSGPAPQRCKGLMSTDYTQTGHCRNHADLSSKADCLLLKNPTQLSHSLHPRPGKSCALSCRA